MSCCKKDKNSSDRTEAQQDKRYSCFLLFCYCIGYGAFSGNQSVIAKKIYKGFPTFQSPITIIWFQFIFNVTVLSFMALIKQCRKDSFSGLSAIKFDVTPFKDLLTIKLKPGIMCGSTNLIQLLVNSQALYLVSIPMYGANRRCAIFATVIATYIAKGEVPIPDMVLAVSLQVLGSFIAGFETLDRDYIGFIVVWITNFIGAFSYILISTFNSKKLINAFDTCFFFSLVGFCIIAPYVIYSGNHLIVFDILMTPGDSRYEFIYLFCLSSVSGLIITVFTMLVVALGGPIPMNITGNLRDVFVTYISFMLFDDTQTSALVLIGLAFSFLGSIGFTYIKIRDDFSDKKPDAASVEEQKKKDITPKEEDEDRKGRSKKPKVSRSPGKKSPTRSGKTSPSRKTGSPTTRKRAKVE